MGTNRRRISATPPPVAVEIELGVQAGNPQELRTALGQVPASSLFHHLYEARLRNPGLQDDVSRWLEEIGDEEAASRLADLDIYMLSLEDCRWVVLELLSGEGGGHETGT